MFYRIWHQRWSVSALLLLCVLLQPHKMVQAAPVPGHAPQSRQASTNHAAEAPGPNDEENPASTALDDAFAQVNEAAVYTQLHTYMHFAPANLASIQPHQVLDGEALGIERLDTIKSLNRLADGTLFLVANELAGGSHFVYLYPDGRRENIRFIKKVEYRPLVSPQQDYLWFYTYHSNQGRLEDQYDLYAFDIKNKTFHPFSQLVQNPSVFADTLDHLLFGDSPAPKRYFSGMVENPHDINIEFVADNSTRLSLINPSIDAFDQYTRADFHLPPLRTLLQRPPPLLAPSAVQAATEAEYLYQLNPYAALNPLGQRISIEGKCIRQLPYANVKMNFGLPDPKRLPDQTTEVRGFYFYLNPNTLRPVQDNEFSLAEEGTISTVSTVSTGTRARYTGVQLLDTKTGCLKQMYVHGVGVLKQRAAYKHFLVTSIYIDRPNHNRNRLIIWNLKTHQAVAALDYPPHHNSDSVEHIVFDERKQEVIAAIDYVPALIRWRVPQLF